MSHHHHKERSQDLYEKKMIESLEINRYNQKIFFNIGGKKCFKLPTRILT